MWECKYCKEMFAFSNKSEKANHSRWCEYNPKRNDTLTLADSIRKSKDLKYGKKQSYNVNCYKCNKDFQVIEREFSFPIKEKYFCSRICANSRIITDEHKAKTSKKLTKNKLIHKMCLQCNVFFSTKRKNCKYCSLSCAQKFRHKDLDKSSLSYYRAQCGFKFNLKDYPEEFDFSLIEQFGWYKAKNRGDNLNGVSRDHLVSVRFGYDNNVDPYLMSHPANCQLLQHGKNVSKGKKSNLSLDELIENVRVWNLKYNMPL